MADQRVANLTAAAWEAVTDRPLGDGLLPVYVHLDVDVLDQPSAPLPANRNT